MRNRVSTRRINYQLGDRVGDLEVVELYYEGEGGRKRRCAKVKCHVCRHDHEMYGDAIFRISVYDLDRGRLPCGCAKIPKYTQDQWRVKLHRKASEQNYEILEFLGANICQSSYLKIRCNRDGHIWESCSVGNFVKDRTCPVCAGKARGNKRAKPDELFHESFMKTGMFLEGTKFWRKSHHSRTWCIQCPKCGDEVFESDNANLKAGKRPCNCSTGGGFDTKLPADFYVLRVVGEDYGFTGYGISNFLERRIQGYNRELDKVGLKIVESYAVPINGNQAFVLENLVKKNFELHSQSVSGFKREATYYESYQAVCDFVDEWLFKNT